VKLVSDLLKIDNDMVEKKREEMKLPKPAEFDKGRINIEEIEKFIELAIVEFDENCIGSSSNGGFSAKGVDYKIQLNRLQQVFGRSHVKVEHSVTETKTVGGEGEKKDMFYYKVYTEIKIGNYTLYTNKDNAMDSNFVPVYITDGIGWAGAVNEGTAEKNARANGFKEACKNMGMLRYLYINEEEDDGEPSGGFVKGIEGNVELIADATIYQTGALFLKARAKDVSSDKEIELIVYRNNSMNEKAHKEMIDSLEAYKNVLKRGKPLKIEYIEKNYQGKPQYIVQAVKKSDEK
jgi:hypothetical protein